MSVRAWVLPDSVLSRGNYAATIAYAFLFVISTVVAWISRDVDEVGEASEIQRCEQDLPGKACFRKEAALRIFTGSIIYLLPQAIVVAFARLCSHEGKAVSFAHAGAQKIAWHLVCSTAVHAWTWQLAATS